MNNLELHRNLWDEKTTKSLLGEDGYAWFLERAAGRISNCSFCKGLGTVIAPDPAGIWRRPLPQECPSCGSVVERLIAFTREYFQNVPPAYRHCLLRTLEPSTESLLPADKQAEIIAMLKENPKNGYAFIAPPKAGKTVFATALYSKMLYDYYMNDGGSKFVPVRRTTTKTLFDRHADPANRKKDDPILNEPDVTADKIRAVTRTGRKYRLFLEDMNGGNLTAANRDILFDVINAVYESEGQLVITSKLTPEDFKRLYGEDLFWRIAKLCGIVNLFE